MGPYSKQAVVLGKRLLWVFACYTLCRLLFFALNHSYFQNITTGELLGICFYGLRFDAFSILAINSLFILLSILPFSFSFNRRYQLVLKWLFIVSNAIGLLLNFIDFAYYPFTQKRTTWDVFNMTLGGQAEIGKLLPLFFRDFWYVVLLYILCVWLLINRYNRIRLVPGEPYVYSRRNVISYIISFVAITAITVLGIRGGTQRVPIGIVDGGKYVKPQYVPLLINTPFSVIKSAELKTVPALQLMPDAEALKFFDPIHQPDTGAFKNKNVCIIILESFSKEYTGIGGRKSYTPFLDSLMGVSLVFTNAYANGKKSIEGIPAILASMPSLMEDPYLNSYYSNNTLTSFPALLKQKGYYSAFFHGGTNGTMNFDVFCKLAGFDGYFGRTEYNNDADYDGQWGIWDEPFLKYTAKKMSGFKEPFFTGIFTLSSHHPFKVPEAYKGKFPKGTIEIHESIGYADYALRQFFKDASRQPWFNNTIFVLTPDHTGISEDPFYSNSQGQYSIPIAFYRPDRPTNHATAPFPIQQIDILPIVLDGLNYDKPYFCFGTNVNKQHPCIYYNNGSYFLAEDSLFYVINDFKVSQAFDYRKDSLQSGPVTGKNPQADQYALDYAKAFIQTYNNSLINNKTYK